MDKKLEAPLIDRNELALRASNGRRGPRPAVYHRHLTENPVRSDHLQDFAAEANLHFARVDDIHDRSRLTLLEDNCFRRKDFNRLISEHLELSHNHAPLFSAEIRKVGSPQQYC